MYTWKNNSHNLSGAMKAVFKNFISNLAIIAVVTAIVAFMSYKTYDFPMLVNFGTGLAAAGAFVFIFLGFDGAKGFMTKT